MPGNTGEQRLDAARVLEEHRRDLVDGLDLLEALLDGWLALMGLEDLDYGEVSVVQMSGYMPSLFLS